MKPAVEVALCILNRNEADNLNNFINQIDFKKFSLVFAVDGKSTDNSVEIFNNYGVKTIIQDSMGRGNAIRIAVETTFNRSNKIDFLILISSDGNEDPKDIDRIIELLPDNDLVIASRMLKDSWNEEDVNFFKPRKYANKFFAFLAYLMLKNHDSVYISDPLNGLRGFSIDFAKSLNLVSKYF